MMNKTAFCIYNTHAGPSQWRDCSDPRVMRGHSSVKCIVILRSLRPAEERVVKVYEDIGAVVFDANGMADAMTSHRETE